VKPFGILVEVVDKCWTGSRETWRGTRFWILTKAGEQAAILGYHPLILNVK
jgi:hypothetical protein